MTSDNVLQRLVVDEQLIRMARRCRERWHSLQELGGVHNSYADAAEQAAKAELAQIETEAKVADEVVQPVVEKAVQAAPEPDADAADCGPYRDCLAALILWENHNHNGESCWHYQSRSKTHYRSSSDYLVGCISVKCRPAS